MRKRMALIMVTVSVLLMAGCGASNSAEDSAGADNQIEVTYVENAEQTDTEENIATDGVADYPATIMVNDTVDLVEGDPMPAEVDESAIIGYTEIYISELAAYEYRPRGFYEVEYPDIAYPEVVGYTENEDGTVVLHINAVYPNGNMSKEFSHTTVIRPLNEDSFQYVSNEIILPEEEFKMWFDLVELLDDSSIPRSRIKKENGIATAFVMDVFRKEDEYILIEDMDFDAIEW